MPYDSNLPRSRKVFPVGVRALAIVVPVSSAAKLIVFASALALAAFNALAQRATKVDPANSKIVIVYGSDSVVWAGLVFVQFDRADVAAGAIDGIGHPGLVDRFRNSTLVEIERLALLSCLDRLPDSRAKAPSSEWSRRDRRAVPRAGCVSEHGWKQALLYQREAWRRKSVALH